MQEVEAIEGFRLSPQQRHLWSLQHGDHSLPYRCQCTILIEGDLRPDLLRRAVQSVVAQSEVLRTVFRSPAWLNIPVQVVTSGVAPSFDEHDLRGLDDSAQESEIETRFQAARRLPFDFEQGPLVRATLFTLSPARHMLLLSVAALCADSSTLKGLMLDIGHCYEAALSDEELIDERVQYADLSEWQNELLEAEETRIGRDYWQQQNLGALSAMKLPFVRRVTGERGFDPRLLALPVDADLLTKLSALSLEQGVELYTCLLACWQVLAWRLTAAQETVVGLCCEGRDYEELEGAMGLLARYLPLASQPAEAIPFNAFLAQVAHSAQEVRKWQECFDWEQVAVGADDEPRFSPVSFEWHDTHAQCALAGLTFSILKQYACIEQFEVKLSCARESDSLVTEFHYDSSRVEAEDIRRLASQFHTLLASVASCPEAPLIELTMLSEGERRQLLFEFNSTSADYSGVNSVHQVFEEHARRTPLAEAVVFEDECLTYGELNRRANQLAHHLRSLGVGPEVLVGLCVERSLEMVVGLLGVLKAGGAYLPLDPTHPTERLAFMIDDAEVRVLLTQERLLGQLPRQSARLLCLDSDWERIAVESEDNPASVSVDAHLVYVIYTSGTSGRPKGIAVEHRQLLNYVKGISEQLALPAGASYATASTFAADLGNTAIFPSLLSGGCLHVVSQERFSDPLALADYFSRHCVDCLKIVPSHLEALLTGGGEAQILPRRCLILGGEPSRWNLVETLRRLAPDCRILNHYGPTEATVGVLTHFVEEQTATHTLTLPLGRPLANTQIYLLDSRMQPVPTWVPGELYIGGDNVARGYINRPDLTAEKFIANPFGNGRWQRLYMTGDVARHLPDGRIEFLGRLDEQVKIRGFRIELGEIDGVLTTHPAVRQALTIVQEAVPGDMRLVSYFVPATGEPLTVGDLRDWLAEKLPQYMLPTTLLMLDALPLMPNGKVDRRALPSPDEAAARFDKVLIEPRTEVESLTAGIWSELLQLERVGVEDNFFELGGHSLLVTRVISRLRSTFKVELPMRAIFEHPTVSSLAGRIEAAMRNGQNVCAPPITRISRDVELPLSFAQQRLWFLDQLEPGHPFYNISAGVRLRGQLNVAALEQTLGELIRRHEVLRTTFRSVGGQSVQIIAEAAPVTLPLLDLGHLPSELREMEIVRLARQEARQPFDLTRGPLLRAGLLRLSEEDHVLLATMHHIISDGWSIAVLTRETAALYAAYSAGEPSPLEELSIQYADYASWQREWMQGEMLEEQVEYWREQLAGAPPVLELPTDRPRPAVQTYDGSIESLVLPRSLRQALQSLSDREGATLFMTMLAAFKTLLFRYARQPDIVVSTGIANRTRAEVEPLIGFFVNTLTLRTDLSGDPSFRELLGRVRETALGAYAHQDVPFEMLVERLQPERSPSHSPLFQVMFMLQNVPRQPVELPKLEVSRVLAVEHTTAKFDLTIFIEERDEQFVASLEYNTALFDASTIAQMLAAFHDLLTSITFDPQQRLSELSLINPDDERRLRRQWRATQEAQQEAQEPWLPIHQRFTRTAERFSTHTAIACAGRQLSYGELDAQSNRLANLLLSSSASRGSIVAMLTDDPVEMIIAIIGTLKAGCAFMPLDPRLPVKRLVAMTTLAPPLYLVADSRLIASVLPQLPGVADSGVKLIGLNPGASQEAAGVRLPYLGDYHSYSDCDAPSLSADPDALAYIYFTSGSTGTPKAIAGRLKAIDHFIQWEIDALGLTAGVRVSQLLAPTFDGSLRDFLVPLCLGGTVCVPQSRDLLLDVRRLVEWIDEQQITLIHCVPSLLRAIINEGLKEEQFHRLRHVVLAGEALLPSDVERWMNSFGERVQIVNLYGTSETTMAKLCYLVRAADQERASIPIGEAISGASVLLLDEMGRVCRVGAVGEIYIQSEYRSLGYYNQPELTAEAFVPHPFAALAGEVIYRTGDMGRQLEDGVLEYLGRRDQQVKVRGQRVELAEVESVLRAQSGVADVAVIAREDASGYTYLCAYVVLAADGEQHAEMVERVSAGVAEELADYMVPSAYVVLEELPRTISGKVDRRALPEPAEKGRAGTEYIAPGTAVEEVVAGIWIEVLGVERAGVRDNFFHIGGHSLLATQVLTRLREVFGIEVPLRRLFEEPTIRGLAANVENELRGGKQRAMPALERVSREEELVLSFAQQRLWFLDQLEPGSIAYNMPAAARLTGRLDIAALERTLNEIIRRQEVLRTTFTIRNGQPVQLIHQPQPINLELVDLSTLPEPERADELRRLSAQEAEEPFALSSGPLLRTKLIRLTEESHVLLCTIHHIASDGWSMGVLVRELATLYAAFSVAEPSPLEELEIQYADYAHWQREWLQGEVLEEQLQYWREQLAGAPPLLELPTDRPRPPVQSSRGDRFFISFTTELSSQLQRLSRDSGVTLFMTLLSGFSILLARYSGQEEVVIGSPIANRRQTATEPLIGFFVNTLTLRTDLSGDPSFRELLGRVRETALGAYAHQDVPFEMLVEELEPERNLSHTPVFQVVLSLQNAPLPEVEVEGLVVSGLVLENSTAKFDIVVNLNEEEGVIRGGVEYRTDLFDEETIALMTEHYERLLEQIVHDPHQHLHQLSLLSESQRSQLLFDWNQREAQYPQESCIHQLFAQQVARSPHALALSCAQRHLSYLELSGRSNQLAHHLRSLGIKAGCHVAICLDHSPETIVSILGVLKCGAAYLPLDPHHPSARLAFMLTDARVSLLLTQQHLAERFTSTAVELLCIDTEWEMIAQQSSEELSSTTTTAESAYLIYTSGSTGEPKAVMISHQSLVNYICWAAGVYLQDEQHSFALYSSLAFDLTVTSIFTPLITGNTLFIYQVEGGLPPLLEILEEQRVGVLKLTPSHLSLLKERDNRQSRVKRLIVGGEALTTALAREVSESFGGDVEIYNEYGPTEATVGCMIYQFDAESDVRTAVPIGIPAANTTIYVLDERMEPVAENVLGEIYIGGEGLAIGYLNRAEMTAQRFVPDPFTKHAGARLYRTGDVGRRLRGGHLEYIGRGDEQVKYHGYRVELGEINSHLNAHPQVRDSLVRVLTDHRGNEQMVAYYVSRQEIGSEQLRQHLGERLMREVVPQLYVHLRRMPLTLNGKVNVEGLPGLEEARGQVKVRGEGVRTAVEEGVRGVWEEVLGIEGVGVEDNFFELGGHSLLATQVLVRVREVFGVEVGLRRLFEEPSIRGLAANVENELRGGKQRAMPALERVSREEELVLSFAQQRLWFLDQLEPGSTAYNISAAVRLKGNLNVVVLEQSFGEIIRRHEALRTSFAMADERPVQLIAPAEPARLEAHDLSHLSEEERESAARRLAAEEAERPFNLSSGPLLRVRLLRLSEDEHVLLFSMHHIISDGWSMGVLVREMGQLYEAYSQGRESPLPELQIQYADYAHWQREWLQGEVLEEQLQYWREQLAGAPPLLELPTDRPRPPVQSSRGDRYPFLLKRNLSQALKTLSRRAGVTLYMTLLAALQTLLARYSGQKDVVIGSPIANRTRSETEALIGFFVNTLALRTSVGDDPTVEALMGRVREVSLGAYTHQDVPFEMLVEELEPERSLSHTPVFQVVLSLQNAPLPEIEIEGLRLSALGAENKTAKFDLVINLNEVGEVISGIVDYRTDLFDEETIALMIRHYERLLEQMAENEGRLSELKLLSTEEQHEVVYDWNQRVAEYPQESCIHQLFQAQVTRTPQAIAVSFGNHQLSYMDLNRRSNQLAHHLRSLGIAAGCHVAICLDHSPETIVCILGVLKAGAAYLPLDPHHPSARLSFMIEDARVSLLLTQQHLAERFSTADAPLLCIDTEWEMIAQQSSEELSSTTTIAESAYLIYTSGSTGEPKAVMISHQSLVNYICWAADVYLQDEQHSFALYSSLAFDLTVTSIFTPLMTGNTIFIYRTEGGLPPLLEILEDDRVGVLKLTPSHLSLIKERDNRESKVKRLIVGGEALTTTLAREVSESFGGDVEIYNEYGPTEATVGCMIYQFDAESDVRTAVPIGIPAANTTIYVLDERMQPVAENVLGEIYIGGEGLAIGYWQRAALTAQRFVPDPYSSTAGARLYRTGDVGRRLRGGHLEYIGRGDEQVKYHGYRVELGEINSHLNAHPQVRDSLVRILTDHRGNEQMVAYYVSRQELGSEQLRQHLGERLMREVVPQLYVHLRRMPLTLNGKINVDGLPGLEEARGQVKVRGEGVRTAVEEGVRGVWEEVLGIEGVGVEDNFFELGGHSLLATQVLVRVREVFGVEVGLRRLFEEPSIRGLAQAVEAELRAGGGVSVPALERVSREEEMVLSFAQQRLWFIDQLQAGSPFYNMFTAIRLSGPLNITALEQALVEISNRHESLRTSFKAAHGRPVQVISASAVLSLCVIDLQELHESKLEDEVHRLAAEEARRPFNLAQSPPVRVTLLRLREQEHVLLFTMHHIISDGWSLNVLVREVATFYEACSKGQVSPLAELPIQCADFAVWQRSYLQGEVLESQLSYWKEQLGDEIPIMELPSDRARPQVQTYQGATCSFALTAELVKALNRLSRQEGITLYMLFLAAFQTLLHRYTGQDEVRVGSPFSNRNRTEIQGLIGCFINIMVLRADLAGNPSFKQFLRQVKEAVLGAYAHQDLPFEVLVEHLQPERKLNYTPLFQVWFVFNPAIPESIMLPELKLAPVNVAGQTAQFDLTLSMSEVRDEIRGDLTYSTDLFDQDTIEEMAARFKNLLESVAANPDWRLLDIPLGGQQEPPSTEIAQGLPIPEQTEDQFVL